MKFENLINCKCFCNLIKGIDFSQTLINLHVQYDVTQMAEMSFLTLIFLPPTVPGYYQRLYVVSICSILMYEPGQMQKIISHFEGL